MRKLYLLVLAVSIQLMAFSQTTCTAVTSFYETFDSVTAPALPNCWAKVGTGGVGVNTQTANAKSTPNCLYIYSSTPTSLAVASMRPVSNASAGTHWLRFDARGNFTAGGIIEVGYLTDPADAATFVSIQAVTVGSLTYQTYSVIPTGLPAGDVVLAFRHTGTVSYSVLIDNVAWEPTPSCLPPTGLTASSVTSSGATVDWTAPVISTPSSYRLYYSTSRTAPDTATTPTVSGIAGTTATISGLNAATKYYYWVSSSCGTGVSTWSNLDSFTTACTAVATFSENFDAVTPPSLPTCWSTILRGGTLATAAYVRTVAGNASTTPNSVVMYNSTSTSSDDLILVSPAVTNLSAGTYQLTFFAKNSAAGEDVEIGTLSDNSATATFTPLTTVTLSTTYTKYTVSFAGYTGTDTYIGIRRTISANNRYVYLDNIVWSLIPSCSEPTSAPVANVSASTADISWVAPVTGSPASYEVYYSTTNTAPIATTTPTVTGITNTTTTLNNLTSATKYYYWVRSNCGTAGTSAWTLVDSFATQCNSTVPPYSLTFEGSLQLPLCVSIENAGTGNNWKVIANPGYGFTGNVLNYPYSGANAANAWFYTQGINLTAGTSYRLAFRYGNNSATYTESLEVKYGTSASSGSMNDLIVDYPTIKLSGSAISETDFTPTTTGTYYFGFHAYSIANQFNLYVDDISLTVSPTCGAPTGTIVTNVSTAAAQLDWTSPVVGAPSSYEVYYSTSNVTPTDTTTATITGITSTTANLSGLMSATKYYVWIRTNCGTGGMSVWSQMASFTTMCTAVTTFTQTFDSLIVPALPICWNKVGTTGAAYTQTTNPASAPNTLYIYSSSATNQAIVSMTPVSNAGANTHWLKFSARVSGTTVGSIIQVGYLTDPADSSTFTSIQDVTITTNTYQTYIVTPGPISTGGDVVFAFRNAGSPAIAVLIDNVTWTAMPTCAEPTALLANNVTSTSATIEWTAPAVAPASYDIYISAVNTAPDSSTAPTATGITTATYDAINLNPSSTYYVWVRSSCGASGKSVWSSMFTLVTACGTVNAPTLAPETFTNTVIPNCWTRAVGIIDPVASTLTTSTAGWTIDDFGNKLSPKNTSARLNIWSTTTKYWLITPMYDLGTAGDKRLEFDLAYTPYSDSIAATMGPDDKFMVVISTDGGVTWSSANALRTWDATTPISNTGEHVVIDLAAYTGTVMLAFYGESTVSNADNNVYIDNVAVTSSAVMPVTLTTFKGERQGATNVLYWNTATEQNNKGFELQRSVNGENFSTVAFVATKAANGNSVSSLNYQFADEKPFSGNNYYRLKQVDKDGKVALSQIVLIKGAKANSIVLSRVYPNPAKAILNVVVAAPTNEKVSLIVSDLAGKVVMQHNKQLLSGDNNLTLSVGQLPSGTYMIKAICSNGCETAVSKFVKE